MKKLIYILFFFSVHASAQRVYNMNYDTVKITGTLKTLHSPAQVTGTQQVLVRDSVSGEYKFIRSTNIGGGGSSYIFNNGLTNTMGTVGLGGTLAQTTQLLLNNNDLLILDGASSTGFIIVPGQIQINSSGSSGKNSEITLTENGFGLSYVDPSTSKQYIIQSDGHVTDGFNSFGLAYAFDYSTVGLTTPHWLPDIETVESLIAEGGGAVSSVFGRTGAVTAQSGDYSSFYYPLSSNPAGYSTYAFTGSTSQLTVGDGTYIPNSSDNITEGTTNLYYTIARAALKANVSGQVFTGNISATNLSGTNTGDQTSVNGNAGTATALQTARTINGVSFDGTANITVPAAAGALTGTTLASNVVTSSLTSVGTLIAGSIPYSLLTGTPTVPTAANPTASVGVTAVNGSATTFMRSDAAPKGDTTLFQTVANFFPKGDTRWIKNPMTTQYDLIIGGTSGTPTRLAKGSDSTFLYVLGGVVSYARPNMYFSSQFQGGGGNAGDPITIKSTAFQAALSGTGYAKFSGSTPSYVASIPNADLANSTISGVALGGTLANLTAANSTLNFSGTYTGATARTIGLNLGTANTWTGLPTFNAGISVGLAQKVGIVEGTGGRVGQTTLVAGTIAITITGLTTSSRAFVQRVTPSGVTLTTEYNAVCTANTLTITADLAAGTINTADISVMNYLVIN